MYPVCGFFCCMATRSTLYVPASASVRRRRGHNRGTTAEASEFNYGLPSIAGCFQNRTGSRIVVSPTTVSQELPLHGCHPCTLYGCLRRGTEINGKRSAEIRNRQILMSLNGMHREMTTGRLVVALVQFTLAASQSYTVDWNTVSLGGECRV